MAEGSLQAAEPATHLAVLALRSADCVERAWGPDGCGALRAKFKRAAPRLQGRGAATSSGANHGALAAERQEGRMSL